MNTPSLLALDTSTDLLCVALLTPGGARCSVEPGGPLASARLIPALMQLLAEAGVTLAGLQAIAYGQGPGAFTGLRTACAVTQGLALAHDTPVLAIDSLLIVAEDARAQAAAAADGAPEVALDLAPAPASTPASAPAPASASTQDWWVAMDARMDEVYAAAYRCDPQGWQTRVAPQLWTLPALAALWHDTPPQHLAGSAIAAFAGRLPWGSATLWPQAQDRAAALLRLAQTAWAQGRGLPAEQALPLYLRDKVAFTSAERLAMAMAKPLAAQDHAPAPGLADTASVPRKTVGP